MSIKHSKGTSYPLGATVTEKGTNFCIYSKGATAIELLLFNDKDSPRPFHVIRLNPQTNKTFYYWHVFVEGVGHGQVYGYRAFGDFLPEKGAWFDGSKVLVDPYAKAVCMNDNYSRKAAIRPGDNCLHALKSIVVDDRKYDWEDDKPLSRPYSKTIIYEMHVEGFTKDPSSGLSDKKRGTYAGLIEKIPYLQELGITAVELLPIYQFDPYDAPKDRINYWGYSPINFFAPHSLYAMDQKDPTAPVKEFKDMVKALHKAGIEVILDVVYNHTTEVNPEEGPTINFKGLDASTYYILDRHNDYKFLDFSGCGNSFNANHSIVRRMIMDSLRYWVSEMHVDGFRFDLASVLSRDEYGNPSENPPILWEIESDPILAGTKMIAEAWDAAGLYQVGSFVGDRWSEWNGVYRDVLRRFVKGDDKLVGAFAGCVEGSHHVFQNQEERDPNRSINFVTCHDGFTMNDLLSYNEKHNIANGEDNRDGSNDNFSWNHGHEGTTDHWEIEHLRKKQMKNFFTLLLLSQGTPMILMGDEVRRTQNGNNNAYCQNNELSWFNWNDPSQHEETLRFVKKLIQFNLKHEVFQTERFWSSKARARRPIISWHGVEFDYPDWNDNSHAIAYMLTSPNTGEQLYVMVNTFWEKLEFEIPEPTIYAQHTEWKCLIDTSKESPEDIFEYEEAPIVTAGSRELNPRSVVVLQSY
ncbi:glycogen debranching protein GlgX [Flammeovirga pacifica]|uniref:Glycogen debranching enzyme GlgX n=1 Tax=Flammeovirga pacifica TaxID=915059 RepID=A0A1S1YZS3_FLAPC|nr:glycogen debranching protein GlgX [Flammeovirga pacifica]OHX66498.1 glycogen debranching enzyme GlgX [Flammeovirga pacifica]